ncbi:hypothetical protein MXMO3_03476 (plasmid) [Maritalea myrionectae]|uniref:Uncharacterized protein n=1 Tax=Maritalea myrionectae TaxID=454601 RepID=A0A2R4MJ28_9HYPH|nr:hypothetical protein [Maritalea myrionectae]AVX05979.1 hypothetical protein MXMO3_03476 [Maritalea myrionectae]
MSFILKPIKHPVFLPHYANAGLGFYVAVVILVGPLHISALEIQFADIALITTGITACLIVSLFFTPFVANSLLRGGIRSLLNGLGLRAIFSTLLVLILNLVPLFLPDHFEVMVLLYAIVFLLLSILHKVFFNIAWLNVMQVLTPSDDADGYVSGVRRVNGLVSIGASTFAIFLSVSVSPQLFVAVISALIVIYAWWNYLIVSFSLKRNGAIALRISRQLAKTTVEGNFSSWLSVARVPKLQEVLWFSVLPTLLMPPLLFYYFLEKTTPGWSTLLAVALISQSIVSYFLPVMMRKIKELDRFKVRLALVLFTSINLAAIILTRSVFQNNDNFWPLISLSFCIFLMAFGVAHMLSIFAHNDVVLASKKANVNNTALFTIYDFCLDAVPAFWLFIASLLVPLNAYLLELTIYELFCALSIGIALLGMLYFGTRQKQLIGGMNHEQK